jgi:malonyl-CoA/methylmalonyl-CoA synthetase
VEVAAELPRNAMGKVLKNLLRDRHRAMFGPAPAAPKPAGG